MVRHIIIGYEKVQIIKQTDTCNSIRSTCMFCYKAETCEVLHIFGWKQDVLNKFIDKTIKTVLNTDTLFIR